MPLQNKKVEQFFSELCESYYSKILRYLYAALGEETAARDATQEVFLTALQKCALLMQHPNPGGFLFLTAKNIAKKTRRESFTRVFRSESLDSSESQLEDCQADIQKILDREINEEDYIEMVLSQLSEEKRELYHLYYTGGHRMSEIAAQLGVKEATLRMRYVRLRREIRALAAGVAEQYFYIS